MKTIWVAASVLVSMPVMAFAEPAPSQVRSNAMIETIAVRGVDCNHLKSWEGMALRALAAHDRTDWPADRIAALRAETARQLDQTECDSEFLVEWIEAARQGFDYEMLPPYLVAYKTLAEMDTPPRVFVSTTLRLDTSPVLEAIDRKLADLAASGHPPEGGKPWPDFIDRTSAAVLEFAASLGGDESDQAAAWIAQSALIVELWYQEGAP